MRTEKALRDRRIEDLAASRTWMLGELATLEAELHARMREMRATGATQVEVMAASGYRSLDVVRKILDPAVRAGDAAARRRNRQLRRPSAAETASAESRE